jgi:hypothetical protein
LRRAVLVVVVICCCALAGCFEWTEDQSGNLKSVGFPGLPVWQAKKPSAPTGFTDMALTPDQAAKVSGPVLVVPPAQPNQTTRYRYYETGQNNCHQDLATLQAEKATDSGGQAPYCTETPPSPPSKGTAFVF